LKKRTIKILIYLSAFSLLGLITTQLFWIRNAIFLSEAQFDHRVSEALQDVLVELPKYSKEGCEKSCIYSCPSNRNQMLEIINPTILDSLLKATFESYELGSDFEYAILNSSNDSVIFRKTGVIDDNFEIKTHKKGLTCIEATDLYTLEVYFPQKRMIILRELSLWLVISIILILIVIFSFAVNIMAILRQKKISEIKNDFINNMTHEFKTPISTISMASEVLMNADDESLKERVRVYSKVIYDENLRLKSQVEQVLQSAMLEKSELNFNKHEIRVHDILNEIVSNIQLDKQRKEISWIINLDAENDKLLGDPMHMRNLFSNLLDNACKYSGESPIINISTKNEAKRIIVAVGDNGIGISPANQKYIFDKFYRVHTGDVHNVKGFGLGLFYVKSIVTAHGGTIKVQSEIDKGSVFEVTLPLA